MQDNIFQVTHILEIMVSIIVIIAIIISLIAVPEQFKILLENMYEKEALRSFLAYSFNIVIGIEFLRMLSKHTFNSLIEVLLFAIARELVVEHTSSFENLIAIIGITLLFIIRKYLLDNSPEE